MEPLIAIIFSMSGTVEDIQYDPKGVETDSVENIVRSILQRRWDGSDLRDYLVSDDPKASSVLSELAQSAVSKDTIADSLRAFLSYMVLPKESREVYIVLTAFSKAYLLKNPDCALSLTTVQYLAYSILLLNADLHHPGVTRKMSFDEFLRNVVEEEPMRLSTDFYRVIYDSVERSEIRCTQRFSKPVSAAEASLSCVIL